MDKILIDTGPSEKGWHRAEYALSCAQRYAYRYVLGLEGEDRGPLLRGTLGHVALAHHYVRLGCIQHHLDPERYYEPMTAIELMAKKLGPAADEFVQPIKDAVLRYIGHYQFDHLEVKGVEIPVEMTFNGHRMTQRFDLVVRDTAGKYWIYDHKFVSKADQKSVSRYTLSGQFLEMAHQGQKRYGVDFGGCRINLIAVGYDKFVRASPEIAPFALQQFPQAVADAEAVIERNKDRDPWHWPRAFSETTCMTPYGPCTYFDLCRFGPAKPK
jgi:hypothetical protein